jgi:hypothetical protein
MESALGGAAADGVLAEYTLFDETNVVHVPAHLSDEEAAALPCAGDVFQIQSDRDYPVEGRNEFSMFGNVNFTDTYHIPVNVLCISAEKVPPYRLSPVLGKIVDFKLGKNRMGKSIIIPVVDVLAVLGTQPYTNANEEVIINQP